MPDAKMQFKLVPLDGWPVGHAVDPYLQLAIVLAEAGDLGALGMYADGDEPPANRTWKVPVLAEFSGPEAHLEGFEHTRWYSDGNPSRPLDMRIASGTINLTAAMRARDATGVMPGLRALAAGIGPGRPIRRLKVAMRARRMTDYALASIGIAGGPGEPRPDASPETGRGVIVGVIDDGCAFAHPNFLRPGPDGDEPRVLALWDQTSARPQAVPPAAEAPWQPNLEFGYGRVLPRAAIAAAIGRHPAPWGTGVDAPALYAALDYPLEEVTHGTRVLDIAAGNGRLTRSPGVAPDADIVFVQIPSRSIERPGDGALATHFLDGVAYILSVARAAGKPAVINISYGGYSGPHDGTTLLERGIDALLRGRTNAAVVVSAGNAADKGCHAGGRIAARKERTLDWIVPTGDPTLNLMEIWYPAAARLEIGLRAPEGEKGARIGPGECGAVTHGDQVAGWVFHGEADAGNGHRQVLIALRPTATETVASGLALAPAGRWEVSLHAGDAEVAFDAWIERDDAGRAGLARRLQSRFADADASPDRTLGNLAGGELAISVGAYNLETGRVCGYSAYGSRHTDRPRPDVHAPAEVDASGRGLPCATALSPWATTMNGTSVAAPQVTGVVALMLELAVSQQRELTAAEIRDIVRAAARRPDPGGAPGPSAGDPCPLDWTRVRAGLVAQPRPA